MEADRTAPSRNTRAAEQRDAAIYADADRLPTEDEEAAAETAEATLADHLDEIGAHEREMNERGAAAKGEGRIA